MSSFVKNYDFENKVAIVTGVSEGIGEAIALQLAQYGAKLTINGHNEQALQVVSNKIKDATGQQPLMVAGNFIYDFLPRKLITQTIGKYGRLDILINNAGISSPNDDIMNDMVMKDFDDVFAINVRSVMYLIHLAIPYLEKTKGNIVNISSVASHNPFSPVHRMSKAAVNMLTKAIAQELAPKGIRVNSVNAEPMISNLNQPKEIDLNSNILDLIEAKSKNSTSTDTIPYPTEVANLVSFVASTDAADITGSNLVTDTDFLIKSM